MVDVDVAIEIPRAREEVAAFAADPDNTTTWYPSGFAKVAAPVMARSMRRAMTADLRRLRDRLSAR